MQTIVVVSTSRTYVDLMTEVLVDEGYATRACLGADCAADVIRREQPALVLLDLWLEHPQAGEMVLALLHHDHATRHIPVILCADSERSLAHMQSLCDENRCAFLIKPFDMAHLLTLITKMCGSGQLRKGA